MVIFSLACYLSEVLESKNFEDYSIIIKFRDKPDLFGSWFLEVRKVA